MTQKSPSQKDSVLQPLICVKYWQVRNNMTWPLDPFLLTCHLVLMFFPSPPVTSQVLSQAPLIKPRSAIPPGVPSPVHVGVHNHNHEPSSSQQALHESFVHSPLFYMGQSFSPSPSMGFLFGSIYRGSYWSQLPVLRFLYLLWSQLVRAVGINQERCPLPKNYVWKSTPGLNVRSPYNTVFCWSWCSPTVSRSLFQALFLKKYFYRWILRQTVDMILELPWLST